MSTASRVRWNLVSHRAAPFLRADVIVVSIPKSGRTWLRFFLLSYFCELDGQPFSVLAEFDNPRIPRVIFTHDLFEHAAKSRPPMHWVGRHLIPLRARRSKPIVLMVRDPRDLVVSLYFQQIKRESKRRFEGSMPEMLRHPTLGIHSIVDIMNAWLADWADRGQFMLLRYEDCRRDPATHFRNVLSFMGCKDIDERAFGHALTFSSFDNMKALESGGLIKEASMMQPGQGQDPESFKVRRGKVGGYRDYLDDADIEYLNNAISKLDRRFGY